jgi:hypothetical protein
MPLRFIIYFDYRNFASYNTLKDPTNGTLNMILCFFPHISGKAPPPSRPSDTDLVLHAVVAWDSFTALYLFLLQNIRESVVADCTNRKVCSMSAVERRTRPWYRPSWLSSLVVFLSTSRQMCEYYLKLVNDRFVPRHFQCIIHLSPFNSMLLRNRR